MTNPFRTNAKVKKSQSKTLNGELHTHTEAGAAHVVALNDTVSMKLNKNVDVIKMSRGLGLIGYGHQNTLKKRSALIVSVILAIKVGFKTHCLIFNVLPTTYLVIAYWALFFIPPYIKTQT